MRPKHPRSPARQLARPPIIAVAVVVVILEETMLVLLIFLLLWPLCELLLPPIARVDERGRAKRKDAG